MQWFRPVGDSTFSWSEEKVSKKTDTESLSNPIDGYTFKFSFLTHQFIRHVRVSDELTANVLFAVAESYPSFGKAQRWGCRIEYCYLLTC
ncbi:hypothetical protein [Psychromonas algicola]|uniref:hypothetical protein n=1 Tax=Psychromonas algicola TaxID=2555642 RepID=UPI001067DAFE|nr:hypothetical protein [Psychromonas sp. RZ5]TEW52024.1 hypothetical protein E2R67_04460 [Psychromonas sp. RZ5]